MSCVVVLIGNDDEEEDADDDEDEEDADDEEEDEDDDLECREGKVDLACACARRLWHVLSHTRMFSGRPVCGYPILLPNKSKKKIREGIREAVQLVKDHEAAWLIIYYAGHAFWDEFYKEVVIEPKARRRGMKLVKQVKLTVHKEELEFIKTTIFVDSCLVKKKARDEAEDDYQLRDSKNFLGNTFLLVKSCELGESVRDGCLFARAIERCARVHLDQRSLKEHVEELAWQLSFGRLCPTSSCIAEINYMVLSEKQRRRGLFENTHFLRFALDLWTEDKLEPEHSDIDDTLQILQRIATEFERKQAAFEESWHELEAIGHTTSLEGFLEYLQHLETPVKDGSWRPMPVLIPENVRAAIVEVLQEKIRDPKFQWESETNFADLRYLLQDIGEWYKRWEGEKRRIPQETGTCNFLLDEEVKDFDVEGPLQQWPGLAYSLVVEDLDVKNFEESERKSVAANINQLCEDFGIPGRVYLVPGSLWIVFCVNVEPSRDCRKKLAASLKSWIDQQKQSGANGWTLARDPCWKPLHAVPDQVLDLVRQVESLCATSLPTKPMWLRASDLRNLVAETMREKQLEEWRVVVFEGLVERRGDSWLQGTGTLGCCLLPHFHDERLDHRMQEVANLACMREQNMRPELQALVFLLQRAQLELTDKEWTQVVDNARVCYERLKTALRKVMLDKDTDLIVMNDLDLDSGLPQRCPLEDNVVPGVSFQDFFLVPAEATARQTQSRAPETSQRLQHPNPDAAVSSRQPQPRKYGPGIMSHPLKQGTQQRMLSVQDRNAARSAIAETWKLANKYTCNFESTNIIVVGQQSSGKTSFVERFLGYAFSVVGTGMATKRPTVLTIYPHQEGMKVGDVIRVVEELPGGGKSEEEEFGDTREKTALESLFTWCVDKNKGEKPVKEKLFITIYSQKCDTPKRIMDLPGVRGNDEPGKEGVNEVIMDMVKHELQKPTSIVICLAPSDSEPQNDNMVTFFRKSQDLNNSINLQKRLLLVLTKSDNYFQDVQNPEQVRTHLQSWQHCFYGCEPMLVGCSKDKNGQDDLEGRNRQYMKACREEECKILKFLEEVMKMESQSKEDFGIESFLLF